MFLHQRVHVEAGISFSWYHKAMESTHHGSEVWASWKVSVKWWIVSIAIKVWGQILKKMMELPPNVSHHHLHHQTVCNIAKPAHRRIVARQALLECSHRHSRQSLSIDPSSRAIQPSPGSLRFVEIQSMRWFTDKWMGWVLVPPFSVRIYVKMLVPLIPNAHLRMVPWPPKKKWSHQICLGKSSKDMLCPSL